MSAQMIGLLISATWQTIVMVLLPTLFAVVFGLPLGVILLITHKGHILEGVTLHRVLAVMVNGIRSVPFIILMVAITPLTQFIVGTSIGTQAAMVPLALAAIPFLARIVESAMREVPRGLIEALQSMGATPLQMVYRALIPEALPGIIRGITLTMIALVGYSAMAGAIGGGGLGDLGVRYGYDRFEVGVMVATVAILIVLVQSLQWMGDFLAKRLARGREQS